MDVGFLLILAGYVAGLLILTARRIQFTRWVLPTTLGIGTLTAGVLYALAPFGISDTAETAAHSLHGGPVVVADYLVLACFALAALAVPVAVHALANRDSPTATPDPRFSPRPGRPCWPPVCAMATAAILVALFTTLTIALFPHHFTVPPQAAADGTCPTCDPSTIVVPPNLRHEYSFEDSVSGAGDGAIALLIRAAHRRRARRATRPPPQPTAHHPTRTPRPGRRVTDQSCPARTGVTPVNW